ncbi:hypothetical protein IWW37_001445 [Coemansia sp. RSA 2050]|nr:hypothetical protein IWW37_001445 [Coemansia sp. RSA 2050]KAJ2734355.1 hypothetical protein IW152_002364 [Coemansia sp. BCRC 34962]
MGGGGFGYPMNGPMMGNGGGYGPYGMGDSYGPMNMGNNCGGGNRYGNMRMRGQRYHAHASPDMWPIPKNPYKAARWNRGNASGFYDNSGNGGPMMNGSGPMINGSGPYDGFHEPARNRSPMDDSDSDDDSEKTSSGDTKVAGVNRVSTNLVGSTATPVNENAGMTDSNTSINLAAMSDKIINIGAFDGASMKATSTSSAPKATDTASASPAKSKAAPAARQTITRSMVSAKPTPAIRNAAKPKSHAPTAAKALTNTAGSKPSVQGITRAAMSVTATPVLCTLPTTHTQQASASKSGKAEATRREPSMKKIRGL